MTDFCSDSDSIRNYTEQLTKNIPNGIDRNSIKLPVFGSFITQDEYDTY